MNNKTILTSLILTCFIVTGTALAGFAQKAPKKSKKDSLVVLSTSLGDMTIALYEETPKHRSNFLKLVKEGFYEDLLFHRIIKNFMIQGGDPDSRNAKPGQRLGSGGPGYRIPAEFNPKFFHKKGALAAARTNNPKKESSGCQFYIVQGEVLKADILGDAYPEEQKAIYTSLGGTPHLDKNYTVYGEVIDGLEVIDKIADQKTGLGDRPAEDIKMNMTLKVLSKKKITKLYGYGYADTKVVAKTKKTKKKKKSKTKKVTKETE